MSFLAGLARSSTQRTCERSLASRSSRIALQTAVGAVNVRRNGTQTPGQQAADTKFALKSVFDKVLVRGRDTTPDQAWERRSALKYTRLQHAPLPDPSTGMLDRVIARLFHFFTNFLFTISCSSRSHCLHYSRYIVCSGPTQARPNPQNKSCTARAYGEQVFYQGPCSETQAQCHPLETTVCTNGRSRKPRS